MRWSRLRFLSCGVIKGGLRPEFILLSLLFCAVAFLVHPLRAQAAAPTATPATGSRTVHGVVKSGNMPIPGAGVSAVNAATKEQINAWTDVDGSYVLRIPAEGHYTLQVQMAAFAASTEEIVVDATHQDAQANFELTLSSRAHEASSETPQRRGRRAARRRCC